MDLAMKISAFENYPALLNFIGALPIKTLQWFDDSKPEYSFFRANSDFGDYHYGVDMDKIAWASPPEHGAISFESVEAARQFAEEHHKTQVILRVLSVLEPSRLQGFEALILEMKAIQLMCAKYADDCNNSRFWNGPTIIPPNPLNETNARHNGKKMAEFLGVKPV
jgi:hypothetical protein